MMLSSILHILGKVCSTNEIDTIKYELQTFFILNNFIFKYKICCIPIEIH